MRQILERHRATLARRFDTKQGEMFTDEGKAYSERERKQVLDDIEH